jgi:hypothetical protein
MKGLQPRWHEDFSRFIETGEASEEFLNFLDHDEPCQKAVKAAFTKQAKAFENLARALRVLHTTVEPDRREQLIERVGELQKKVASGT